MKHTAIHYINDSILFSLVCEDCFVLDEILIICIFEPFVYFGPFVYLGHRSRLATQAFG